VCIYAPWFMKLLKVNKSRELSIQIVYANIAQWVVVTDRDYKKEFHVPCCAVNKWFASLWQRQSCFNAPKTWLSSYQIKPTGKLQTNLPKSPNHPPFLLYSIYIFLWSILLYVCLFKYVHYVLCFHAAFSKCSIFDKYWLDWPWRIWFCILLQYF